MKDCTAIVSSMTSALKAQKALILASIRTTVVKLDSSVTRKGCAYGLEFDCVQQSNVRSVLESSGIKVSRYMNGGDAM